MRPNEFLVGSHGKLERRTIDVESHEPERWRAMWNRGSPDRVRTGPSDTELYVVQSVDATVRAEASWKAGEVRIQTVLDSRRFMGGRNHPGREGDELPFSSGYCIVHALRVGGRAWPGEAYAVFKPIRPTFVELPTASFQTDLPPGIHDGLVIVSYQWIDSCRAWALPVRFEVADGSGALRVDRVREALASGLVAQWTPVGKGDPQPRLSISLRSSQGERGVAPLDMRLLDGGEPRRWSRRFRAKPGDSVSHVRWMWGFDRESAPPATVRVAIDRVALESAEFGGKTGIASGLAMEFELPVIVLVADAANVTASVGTASGETAAIDEALDEGTKG
ncbi:MAG: hypothetical protein JNL80_04830 [Phycisphaerae bacterium]|nr:hypothetical protein [Phycisphaerae bacterium]